MTNSPVFDSDAAYDLLNPKIQRWIRDQGWQGLREVQVRATDAILNRNRDLIIAASTAAGKTEAALLPVLTSTVKYPQEGFSVIYIGPLKALINDQFRRIDELCEKLEIPVVRWHGDAPASAKRRAMRKPSGMILITPESIEAMLIRRSGDAQSALSSARFVIIDELHAFLQSCRGLHVQSLLRRLNAFATKPARRIGLSATIGDLGQAQNWLRPTAGQDVEILEVKGNAPELKLQVKGYTEPPALNDRDKAEITDKPVLPTALDRICEHVFETLRGSNNLVFGGSRRTVESAADRLRLRCERDNVPNEFYPHHGNLSKILREDLELRLKDGKLPTTAVCTSTLELGVDIGSVKSVAHINAPQSLASLRQRLGRTGRRTGVPSILRIYLREPHIGQDAGYLDRLHTNVVRAVAVVRLLVEGFVEPAGPIPEMASTLIHQILAVILERNGIRPKPLYDLLCGEGAMSFVQQSTFVELLRHLATDDVGFIQMAADRSLMLGRKAEPIVQSRDFYAVFESPEEWRLVVGHRTLGTLPVSFPVYKRCLIVFAGQRWMVEDIHEKAKVLTVVAHPGGNVPQFDNDRGEPVHDRVAVEMRHVFVSEDVPSYLDGNARELLKQGRDTFDNLRLSTRRIVPEENDLQLFTWRGTAENEALMAALTMSGLTCEQHDVGITVNGASEYEVLPLLEQLLKKPPTALKIASFVENKTAGKFSEIVPDKFADISWSFQNEAAVQSIPDTVRFLLHQ